MLSQRITDLFRLLQCGNTDIARFAGCSPSNISRLKCGLSCPPQDSRSVLRLAEGVYRYADYENMLDVLKALCGTEDIQAGTLIPALIGWLYGEQDFTPPPTVTPRSRRELEKRRQSFGARLDRAMVLLEISNSQLAAALNIDVSLVSRYRSGIYHPNRNTYTRERLCEHLLARAERTECTGALAKLCGVPPEELGPDTLAEWLYSTQEAPPAAMAETLLRSIDAFTPGQSAPSSPPQLPPVCVSPQYWGTEGLRNAVIRFLTDAAREGGELLLYSDEPMDWMSGDREYFALWAGLMSACVRNGVRIRIIHNVDRAGPEMADAIAGWFPLYMSGMIEPYILRRTRNTSFYHTVFLRPGSAAIAGFFCADAGEQRWYDYFTDRKHLDALQAGFDSMLAGAAPFLRTYPLANADGFWEYCRENPAKKWVSVLHGLSLPTMPEGLLARMLDRAQITGQRRTLLLDRCRLRGQRLRDMLAHSSVDEILCLPDPETAAQGEVRLNLAPELIDIALDYTPGELTEHITAVRTLVEREKNYHLTLLPQPALRDLQIFTMTNAVAVLRCREPYTAFCFRNEALTRSVADYCTSLIRQYAEDRFTTMRKLEQASGLFLGKGTHNVRLTTRA